MDVLPLLEQCLSLLSKMPQLQLEYRPRECNQFADHCAGLGTKATVTQNLSQITPVHVDPPYELCASLGFSIRDVFPVSKHDRTFVECPRFTDLNLKILHSHPTFLRSFARYRQQFGNPKSSRVVQYRPTAFDQEGRLYAQTPSAQLFPKPLRVSLFGHSHADVDMIQAHYELVRRLSKSTHLLPAWQMRQWLKHTWATLDIPAFPDFEKLWPTWLLNMSSLDEMRSSLLRLGSSYVPQALDDFIWYLFAAKQQVVNHPPDWCPGREVASDRGHAFRILENIERTVLLAVLDLLPSVMSVESRHLYS